MKSKNKILLLTMCAVLLVATSIFGTLAYLTDTEAVTNTFTVGKVTLGDGDSEEGLDEAQVNEYGKPIKDNQIVENRLEAPRVLENRYKLIPGHSYTKDPTVHVKNDSEDCYIFVKVENGIATIEADTEDKEGGYQEIDEQITKENKWVALKDKEGKFIPDVYYQKWEKPSDTNGTTDLLVFSSFKIDGENVNATELASYENSQIKITAYAIQADGFETALDAWEAGKFN